MFFEKIVLRSRCQPQIYLILSASKLIIYIIYALTLILVQRQISIT